jgi:hypothetical protein
VKGGFFLSKWPLEGCGFGAKRLWNRYSRRLPFLGILRATGRAGRTSQRGGWKDEHTQLDRAASFGRRVSLRRIQEGFLISPQSQAVTGRLWIRLARRIDSIDCGDRHDGNSGGAGRTDSGGSLAARRFAAACRCGTGAAGGGRLYSSCAPARICRAQRGLDSAGIVCDCGAVAAVEVRCATPGWFRFPDILQPVGERHVRNSA